MSWILILQFFLVFRSDCLWCIGRNDVRNDCLNGRQVFSGRFSQFPELFEEDFFVKSNGFADMDQCILGIGKTFFIHEGFFVELLPRSQTGEFDLDIFIRDEAGHTDHVFGEVEDLHGFAHVEDENLTALGISTRLKDEAYCFRNGHEEADDVRVSDSDRATGFDLSFEQRNDGTVGTQDISEAYCHERRLGILCHGLDDHLTDAF